MDPDDFTKYQITCDTAINEDITVAHEEYSVDIDLSKYNISVTSDDTFDFVLDIKSQYDNTFSIIPEKDNPSIYTSFEQREQHDKYPALKKAWEDYLNMYNLTQGDPPIVE